MKPRVTRLGYLLSRFPTVNHTYLLREIRSLRRLGLPVLVASIAEPDRPLEHLDGAERTETAATFYVKAAGPSRFVYDHLKTLLQRPGGYLAGLVRALRLGLWSPRELARWCAYFAEAVLVGRWMLQQDLRHLHSHYSSSVALLVGTIFAVSVSNTIHGPAEFENPASFRLPEKLRDASFVLAISHYGRSQLMRYCDPESWHKLEVCPLGVEARQFRSNSERRRGDRFEILSVGRLSPEKGYATLLEAIAQLVQSARPVRLRIVGEGPQRPVLERWVETKGLTEYVRFDGMQNPDAVHELYQQADAFALASFAEGVPVVLMEAMAAGLPCVATRITGIPELIEDQRSGLLVTASDVDQLTAALLRLADDPTLCTELGDAGRQRVLEKYDLRTNAARLAEIFKRRLSGQAAS